MGTRVTFLGSLDDPSTKRNVQLFTSQVLVGIDTVLQDVMRSFGSAGTSAAQSVRESTMVISLEVASPQPARKPPPRRPPPRRPPPVKAKPPPRRPPPRRSPPPALANLGLKKAVKSSAVASAAGAASLAVDGAAATCMQTKRTPNPWISIDLGSAMPVDSVSLTNRKDALAKSLHDVEIRVGNTAPGATGPSSA